MKSGRSGSVSGRHAKMKDVAEQAGVSVVTVSRALRNPELVAKDTREKIRRVIEKTNYLPNLVAGSLRSQRTNLVAALMPNIANPLFAATLRGLSDALREGGYFLMVGGYGHSLEEEETLISALVAHRPCAIYLHETRHTRSARALLKRANIPIVEGGDLSKRPLDIVVSFSNFEAGRAIAGHLADRGKTRIGFVGSPVSARSMERLRGYQAACKDRGMDCANLIMHRPSGFENGAEALSSLLRDHPEIDAVIFAEHASGIGALNECRLRNWAVPGRVAIAGFDDSELARQSQPPMTVVCVQRLEMGREAAHKILDRLHGRPSGGKSLDLGFEILQRAST